MSTRKRIKYIHEGQYVAEVEVELIESEEAWSPYLTVADAYRLDDLRDALRQGDLESAAQHKPAGFFLRKNVSFTKGAAHFVADDNSSKRGRNHGVTGDVPQLFGQPRANICCDICVLKQLRALKELPAVQS